MHYLKCFATPLKCSAATVVLFCLRRCFQTFLILSSFKTSKKAGLKTGFESWFSLLFIVSTCARFRFSSSKPLCVKQLFLSCVNATGLTTRSETYSNCHHLYVNTAKELDEEKICQEGLKFRSMSFFFLIEPNH